MSHSKEIISYMNRLGSEAKEASSVLAQASIEQRNASLDFIAEAIELNRDKILSTNQKDLELAKQKSIGSALIDRLELNDNRIDSMISGLKIVSDLPDPVWRNNRSRSNSIRYRGKKNESSFGCRRNYL
ncbi:MAG: hypothetical protein CM15mP86_14030 [Gammaproteobacteria bacterium]|nr:MAG: hypothetical protein CM15mP86_14030 [Gammaproteobacteria bacterium]